MENAFNLLAKIIIERYVPAVLRENLLEFKISKYLSLKLLNNRTNIYVNGILFNQCKYLLLNLHKDNFQSYEQIDSIDEAAEILDRSLENRHFNQIDISPETEFWGHCSNLQAWYENDYDTRLLHRNLAFPLLKALTEAGDPLAKKVFKEEIALRLESGYFPVIRYLIDQGYLNYFTKEELDTILRAPMFIANLAKWYPNFKKFPTQLRKLINSKRRGAISSIA